MNWPLNKNLPQGEGYHNSEFGKIVLEFGLNREQVRRQLNNYKDAKYGNSQIKLILDADQLEEKIRMGLSMTTIDFVTSTLSRILSKDSSSSADFINFSAILDTFPADARNFVIMLAENPEHDCVILLRDVVDHFITAAAEKFPKAAAGLSSAEVGFQRSVLERKNYFVGKWMDKYTTIISTNMNLQKFGRLGQFLHNQLYMEWAHSAIDDERPSVSFPDESIVGKYALPVIYYVAGWTLHSASKALTIAQGKRSKFHLFVNGHSIGKEAAQNDRLPTAIVERRRRRNAQVFCSKAYFDFICFVETVYLSNLALKMLRAYADGDIVVVIKNSLLSSELAVSKFMALCDNDQCDSITEDGKTEIMKYMMERYANMRGTFFARHLKMNNTGSIVDKLANSQATRTKVANAVVSAKAVAEAKEGKLWKQAASNVLDYADNESNKYDAEFSEDIGHVDV